MRPIAVRNIQRADADDIAILGRLGVATVHEAQGRVGLMNPVIRPIYPGAHVAGSAVTVWAHPGDNWMIHVAVEMLRDGDVLVVGVSSGNTDGMFGELLATSVRARGGRGLVIDAGCRDIRSLKDMDFPVWSRAVSAQGTVKATLGAVNVPIVCAGQTVNAGDVVVADDDGVVIVRHEQVSTVVAAGRKREAREDETRARLRSGELGLDIYGMREKLAEAGLVYVDDPKDVPGG
jgi:4-hydroxy-4-methyl-2-oxoglutarate aldolase